MCIRDSYYAFTYKRMGDGATLGLYAFLYLFGGILFHLISETKSQYTLPYIYLQIPMIAAGYNHMTQILRPVSYTHLDVYKRQLSSPSMLQSNPARRKTSTGLKASISSNPSANTTATFVMIYLQLTYYLILLRLKL